MVWSVSTRHELRARVRPLLRSKHYTDDLDSADSAIVSLALAIKARGSTTDGHCQRLARYASALDRTLGLDADDCAASTTIAGRSNF